MGGQRSPGSHDGRFPAAQMYSLQHGLPHVANRKYNADLPWLTRLATGGRVSSPARAGGSAETQCSASITLSTDHEKSYSARDHIRYKRWYQHRRGSL